MCLTDVIEVINDSWRIHVKTYESFYDILFSNALNTVFTDVIDVVENSIRKIPDIGDTKYLNVCV